jgi:hypothetical protein
VQTQTEQRVEMPSAPTPAPAPVNTPPEDVPITPTVERKYVICSNCGEVIYID